jgi:hypothetical protein
VEADRPRLWRTYLISVPVWALLSIPVDRSPDDFHIELREATLLQAAAVALVMVLAAATTWFNAEYGLWSWWSPARTFQRHAAMVWLGCATVAGLYAVSLLFR